MIFPKFDWVGMYGPNSTPPPPRLEVHSKVSEVYHSCIRAHVHSGVKHRLEGDNVLCGLSLLLFDVRTYVGINIWLNTHND